MIAFEEREHFDREVQLSDVRAWLYLQDMSVTVKKRKKTEAKEAEKLEKEKRLEMLKGQV